MFGPPLHINTYNKICENTQPPFPESHRGGGSFKNRGFTFCHKK